MKKSEQINELAAALAKAQGEIRGAVKDSANPFFKSRYADLASVWDACRLPLSKNGLAVIQTIDETERGIVLETLLTHSSGQWISSVLPLTPVDKKPQSMGSAITYNRRYSLQAMVGVASDDDVEIASDDDDDGNAASGVNIPQMKMQQPGPNDGFIDPRKPKPESRRVPGHKKSESKLDPERTRLQTELLEVYPNFMKYFPDVQMTYLLKERYSVSESHELNNSQLEDLLKYMESQMEEVA